MRECGGVRDGRKQLSHKIYTTAGSCEKGVFTLCAFHHTAHTKYSLLTFRSCCPSKHTVLRKLVGKAYLKAATVDVPVSGYRRTGLFPYNGYIFKKKIVFLQETQSLSGCEETEQTLPGHSGAVHLPASNVTSPNSEET
jgi:hypothetical protein